MKKSEKSFDAESFKKKLEKGLRLSFRRLVEEKRKSNGVLVFSKNGKIVTIKAKDIKL